ncbi:hypothetical protein TWF694_005258 [Orbilia ellipsospora]|uniref:Uncharacterized protein n=1 Tax=Orbilia ellipsospora TaxID=2528407 RepID=A0AAV9WU60_9PEZI
MLLSNIIAALPALSLPAEDSASRVKLARRDATEVIYISAFYFSILNPPYYLSYAAYYPTTTLGYNLSLPGANDEVLGEWAGRSLWDTWPTPCTGNTHYELSFPSGVLFQFDLNYGAASASPGTVVGGGWNGFNAFTCRRDSGRVLYDVVEYTGAYVAALINCTRV